MTVFAYVMVVLILVGLIGFLVSFALDFSCMMRFPLIISISSFICLSTLGIIGHKITSKKDAIAWNEGYHANCGGKWDFCQKDGSNYIYKCDKCHKIEIFESIMN